MTHKEFCAWLEGYFESKLRKDIDLDLIRDKLSALGEEAANSCDSCKKGEGNPVHTCPYQEEIHDDYEFQCNCCNECMHQCCMDI